MSRDLLYPAIFITSSFDVFSVHDILIIFLVYHISAASSLLSRSFVNVQHTHPYRRMDHNYVGFQSVDFRVNFDVVYVLVKMDFILVNVSLDKAFLCFISVSHLASGIIVKPKFLKVSICFIRPLCKEYYKQECLIVLR